MDFLKLRSGGEVPLRPKKLEQALWDTEYVAVSTVQQRISYFTSNTYQTGPLSGTAKTREDYNLDTEAALPAPQTYSVHAVQVHLIHDGSDGQRPSLDDVQQLRAYGLISFLQGSKPIWRMPMSRLSGAGIWAQGNAASSLDVINIGSIGLTDYFKNGFRIAIQSGYTFSVELFTSQGLSLINPVRIRVKLIGNMTRSLR